MRGKASEVTQNKSSNNKTATLYMILNNHILQLK
jgi:hypothetical protein